MKIIRVAECERWRAERAAKDPSWLPHRHVVLEKIENGAGWLVQEGPRAMLFEFIDTESRDLTAMSVGYTERVLPLENNRLWVLVPYVRHRKCAACDKEALYRED